jgi:hypothetical protein
MDGILLPFAADDIAGDMAARNPDRRGLLVVGMGVYLLINRRHPRFLARIRPTQLALWSFPRGNGAWGRVDAGADLSGVMQT